MNTTQKGDVSELKFALRCTELNIPILKPIGNNLSYDFVIEYDNNFKRIQVKTAWVSHKNDKIATFQTKSCSKNYTEVKLKSYNGLIDYFAVVSSYHDLICLIPIEIASKSCMSLYYGDTPKSSQTSALLYRF